MKKGALFILSILFLSNIVSALDLPAEYPTQTILSSQIPLTSGASAFLQGLFKLPSDMVLTIQSAVILGVLFLVVFFVINNTLGLIPFFDGGIKNYLLSIIIILLVSISGGIYDTFMFLSSLTSIFSFLGNWGGLGVIIPIGLLLIFSVIILVVLRGVKKMLSKEEANAAGFKVGQDIAEAKVYGKIFKKSLGVK